jgi:NAD(P) transhydrogenase subunit beta
MTMSTIIWFDLAYLIGSICIVWGLKKMSSPDSAGAGNTLAAVGMGLAIVSAIFYPLGDSDNGNLIWIFGGLLLGSGVGYVLAKKVAMTAMPQMVSLLNGMGGATAMILGLVEYLRIGPDSGSFASSLTVVFALLVGSVSFSGSVLAYLKLEGRVDDKKITLPFHSAFNLVLLAIVLAGTCALSYATDWGIALLFLFTVLAIFYGLSFVAPIGGADMPVVISLLNSFTGISAATAGFVYGNLMMIVGGILVGASGTILTLMMCKAMNRSLLNVIVGGFGNAVAGAAADSNQQVKSVGLTDAAIQLAYSKTVLVVPGYGLAVAQAQKVCKELDELLEANGVDVRYGIHPVAGRMPGHMNVLLAEADVPYPKLLDLEEANDFLNQCDAVVVIGANDVVNPAAERDPSSSIYGMPVLKVWQAKNTIVMKRSMGKGYAGIENPLFFEKNTYMLFGDAKQTLQGLVSEVKGLG